MRWAICCKENPAAGDPRHRPSLWRGALEFEVERAKVRIPAVTYSGMLDDRTGYIYLSKFTRGSAGEVRKALMALRDSAGMEQLVLDLRGNGGGLLNESVSIVNLFVPKGTEIVSTRGKMTSGTSHTSRWGRPTAPDMPLVVLIDGQSASASEIVSGTLQDLDRAVIVGMESFGKGSSSRPRTWPSTPDSR